MKDTGRLFFLDIGQHHAPPARGRVLSSNVDGSDLKVLVDNILTAPDGIAIDHEKKHIWWTNMGEKVFEPRMFQTRGAISHRCQIAEDGSCYENDGSISRCDIDGSNVQTIIPKGAIHTPKQCIIAPKSEKLYWCDREGMKVMRADLDGSNMEVLFVSGNGQADMKDAAKWCVGVAVDEKHGKLFWTQKGAPKAGKVSCEAYCE